MKTYLKLVLATAIAGCSITTVCDSPQNAPSIDWEKSVVHTTLSVAKTMAASVYLCLFFGACYSGAKSFKRLATDHEHYNDPAAIYDWQKLAVSILAAPL